MCSLSIRRPIIVDVSGAMGPFFSFVEFRVCNDFFFRTLVPYSTISHDTPVLEVESFVTFDACVKLCLELDGGDLLVNASAIFRFRPCPDFEQVISGINVVHERLVPFEWVLLVIEILDSGYCFEFQLIWSNDVFLFERSTVRKFTGRVANTCSKGAW